MPAHCHRLRQRRVNRRLYAHVMLTRTYTNTKDPISLYYTPTKQYFRGVFHVFRRLYDVRFNYRY